MFPDIAQSLSLKLTYSNYLLWKNQLCLTLFMHMTLKVSSMVPFPLLNFWIIFTINPTQSFMFDKNLIKPLWSGFSLLLHKEKWEKSFLSLPLEIYGNHCSILTNLPLLLMFSVSKLKFGPLKVWHIHSIIFGKNKRGGGQTFIHWWAGVLKGPYILHFEWPWTLIQHICHFYSALSRAPYNRRCPRSSFDLWVSDRKSKFSWPSKYCLS